MKTVLFYGVPSGCSLGAVIALEWLAQPYQLSRIEMMDEWPAGYAAINPRMKTPALLTGPHPGNTPGLSESAAILHHIGQRGVAQGLGFQAGTPEFDRLSEMLSYLTTDFFAAFAPLWTLYDKGENDAATKTVLRAWGEDSVRKEIAYLERLLEGRTWLLGGQRTVADAYLFAVGRWAEYHDVLRLDGKYPNVEAYFKRLQADPAVQFALALERGEDAKGNGSFQGHVALRDLGL